MTEAALRLAFDKSSFLCFKLMYEIRIVVFFFLSVTTATSQKLCSLGPQVIVVSVKNC